MKRLSLTIAVALLIAAITQAANSQSKGTNAPLVNGDIVSLVKAGLSTAVIIAEIETSTCAFDTSPAALIRLKSARVPEAVILAMVKSPNQTRPMKKPTPSPQAMTGIKAPQLIVPTIKPTVHPIPQALNLQLQLPVIAGNLKGANPNIASQKPWPKICLTNGCNWQETALELGSVAGTIYEAKSGNANQIATENDLTKWYAFVESKFDAAQPDLRGYVPYKTFSTTILVPAIQREATGREITAYRLTSTDTLFEANRSMPVTPADFEFVSHIVERLRAGKYRVTNFKWTIIPTKQINSSSFPNPPFVFIYSSMVDFLNHNPDEMAFVIAHEIGHTIDAKSCSGSGLAANASFGIPLIQNQWFKFCENHADNIGLQLMAGAGYDPHAAIAAFQKLEAYQQKGGTSEIEAFLGNHPLNRSRINNVEKLIPIIESQVEKAGQ